MIDKIKAEYCEICKSLTNNNCDNLGCRKLKLCLKWAEDLEKKINKDFVKRRDETDIWADEERWNKFERLFKKDRKEAFHGGGK